MLRLGEDGYHKVDEFWFASFIFSTPSGNRLHAVTSRRNRKTSVLRGRVFQHIPERSAARRFRGPGAAVLMRDVPRPDLGSLDNDKTLDYTRIPVTQ